MILFEPLNCLSKVLSAGVFVSAALTLPASAQDLATDLRQFEVIEKRVRDVYRLAVEKNCKAATSIRRSWSVASCEKIKSADKLKVIGIKFRKGVALLLLSVEIDVGRGTNLQTVYIAARKDGENWYWDNKLTKERTETDINTAQKYENFIASIETSKTPEVPPKSRERPPINVESKQTAELPSVETQQLDNMPEAAVLTTDEQKQLALHFDQHQDEAQADGNLYGGLSAKTAVKKSSANPKTALAACWAPEELKFLPSEKKIVKLPVDTTRKRPSFDKVTAKLTLAKGRNQSIRYISTKEKVMALTFDFCERLNEITGYDGPIVEYLRTNRIPATLYMGGKWMHSHPERSMQLIADPLFELGNHGWTHGNFRMLSPAEIDEQIFHTQTQYYGLRSKLIEKKCAQPFAKTLVRKEMATFRFPYGTCKSGGLQAVNKAGLAAIQWNIVTGDPWKKQTAEAISHIVISKAKPGSIVVMHGNGRGWNTKDALEIFIPKLKAMGYRFVTVSDLMNMGTAVATEECFENKPGDNLIYDKYGKGTGE